MIAIGDAALDVAGHWDGEFWNGSFHHECRATEVALNNLHGSFRPDEWINLSEIDWEDWEWLLAEHPIVAARKGVTPERLREVKERYARFWRSTP